MSLILSGTDGLSDVDGTAATPAIRGTDTNTGIFFPAADTIAFAEGGAEVARFDSSGNLGIGTSSPSTKLNVFGSSPSIYLEQNGSVAGNTQLRLSAAGGSNTGSVRLLDKFIYASTSNGSQLNIGNDLTTPQLVLDSSGNLLVGTTSIIGSSQEILNVRNVNSGAWAIAVGNSVGSASSGCIGFYNSNGRVGFITTSGSATTYSTSSDYRLKDNIAPMTGALDLVQQLKPVTYKWKTDGVESQGFIAHELQAVVPDCVSGEKDAVETYTDEDGVEQTRPKYQGIDTSFLVATLTAAIQELNAKVDAQALEIQALKGVI